MNNNQIGQKVHIKPCTCATCKANLLVKIDEVIKVEKEEMKKDLKMILYSTSNILGGEHLQLEHLKSHILSIIN